MFTENLDLWLKDFGLPCSANGVNFTALLDQPDDTLNLAGVNVVSTGYQLTVKTTDATAAGLASNAAVVVNGQPYVVRDVLLIDDGAFSHITLSR